MKSCKKGYYYCNTEQKCKPIPDGYTVKDDGFLVKEDRQIKKIVKQLRKSVKSHAKQADTLEKKISESKKDHEPEMIRNQLKTAGRASKRIEKHSRKKDNFKAWVQSKITKASDYLDTAADYLDSEDMKKEAVNPAQQAAIAINMKKKGKKPKSMSENTFGLHYKTGKGFDVRVNNTSIRNTVDNVKTGVDAIKNVKSDGLVGGIKKTINNKKPPLKTKPSPSKVVDDAISNYKQLNMGEGSLHKWFKGSKSKDGKGGWVNVVTGGTCASDEPGEGTPKCVSSSKRASMTKAERLSAARRKKKADPGQQQKTGAAKPTYVSTDKPKKKMKEEIELTEVKDKKGKGSGTKDACYHKVKSRYSVWPSAYASGALVKCRKVGAANWGNKSEEVEQIDELSNKTLASYTHKAFKDVKYFKKAKKLVGDSPYVDKKIDQRNKGMDLALKKQARKEEVEVIEATKIDDKLRKDAKPIKPGPLYKTGRTKEQMGYKAVIARRNIRNADERNAADKRRFGMMSPAKETAERREKHKASRGIKTKGM